MKLFIFSVGHFRRMMIVMFDHGITGVRTFMTKRCYYARVSNTRTAAVLANFLNNYHFRYLVCSPVFERSQKRREEVTVKPRSGRLEIIFLQLMIPFAGNKV